MHKTNIIVLFLLKLILILIFLFIFIINLYCFDSSHSVDVNPYCTKCGKRDGFKVHNCTNPYGSAIYCPECGKIKIR